MVTTSLSSCRMRTSGRPRQGYDSALTRAYCAFSRLTGKTKTRGRSERCATYWSCAEIEASRGTWAMTSQAWRCSARGQKRWTARSFTVGEAKARLEIIAAVRARGGHGPGRARASLAYPAMAPFMRNGKTNDWYWVRW